MRGQKWPPSKKNFVRGSAVEHSPLTWAVFYEFYRDCNKKKQDIKELTVLLITTYRYIIFHLAIVLPIPRKN